MTMFFFLVFLNTRTSYWHWVCYWGVRLATNCNGFSASMTQRRKASSKRTTSNESWTRSTKWCRRWTARLAAIRSMKKSIWTWSGRWVHFLVCGIHFRHKSRRPFYGFELKSLCESLYPIDSIPSWIRLDFFQCLDTSYWFWIMFINEQSDHHG